MWCVHAPGHDIEQMMIAITQVDIGYAPLVEHGFSSPCSSSAIGVAGLVAHTSIGLSLCDDCACSAAREVHAQYFAE
jgi:hypothetical protein